MRMIDEIRVTEIDDWPLEARYQLIDLIGESHGLVYHKSDPDMITVEIPEEWPKLKREQLKHTVAKALDKAQVDHGLTATLESVEHVETEGMEGFE